LLIIIQQGRKMAMGFSRRNEKDYLHHLQKKKRKLEATY
jgi:hypothetical protein